MDRGFIRTFGVYPVLCIRLVRLKLGIQSYYMSNSRDRFIPDN